jgi:hypothetical protein
MKNAIAATATLLLFSTSAMAGTFVYTPVHIAPVIHVAPMVHVNPVVHANPVVNGHTYVRTIPNGGRMVTHSHPKVLPVAVYAASGNPKKCAQKSGSESCAKK